MSNSIKFTERGEVFIGVNLKSAENNVLKLEFEVRDTGIGIPEDKVDRLFKAFSQVDSSISRKYGGTGLGLVICEKLINLMGGSIGVESKPGVGTVFRFTITSMEGQKQFKAPVNHNIEALEGKKILVVDDNLNNRSILKSQLEQWRLKPTLTDSGKQALEVLSLDSHFDMILTDLCMPEMDGLQLTKIIKQQYPDIPIILLNSLGVDRTKEYEKLYSSILTKPVRYRVLLKNILGTLGKSIENTGQKNTEEKLPPHFSAKFPLKILVVEDNLVNQKLAVRLLNKLGYEPDFVSNGVEAIKAMNQCQYDVIFMDMQMPEMDGLEATRTARSQLKAQPVIVAMTANVQQKDKEECLLAGMDDFIGKPIKVKEMMKTIEKWAQKIIR